MSSSKHLPGDFHSLECFCDTWCVSTAFERAHLRDIHDVPTKTAFYEAVTPLAEHALDFLDRKPLSQHTEKEKNLMKLLLSYAHVSLGVELQQRDEDGHGQWRPYMNITRAMADD